MYPLPQHGHAVSISCSPGLLKFNQDEDNILLWRSRRYSHVRRLRWGFLSKSSWLLAGKRRVTVEPQGPFKPSSVIMSKTRECWRGRDACRSEFRWMDNHSVLCCFGCSDLHLRTQISLSRSQKADGQKWSWCNGDQPKTSLTVSHLWISLDLTWKINWNYIFFTMQYFQLCLPAFTVTSCPVLFRKATF